MRKLFIILLLFVSLLIQAQTTYYVAPDGGGDNGNDGSSGSPWATLAYAAGQVTTATDTIYLQAGTHTLNSQVAIVVGVSLRGVDRDNTIIVSNVDDTEWTSTIQLYSAAEGTAGNQVVRNLTLNGNNLSGNVGLEIMGRSNVKVHDIYVYDFQYQGVVFNGATSNGQPTYATDNEFFNSTIRNCAIYSGFGRGNLVIGGQEDFQCYNDTIDQPDRGPGAEGYCIKGGTDNGWNKGTTIYDCEILKTLYDGGSYNFAMEFLYNDRGGLHIYNNTVQGSIDIGARIKGDYSYSAYIHNNIIGKATRNNIVEHGIMIENKTEFLYIRYNYFYNLSHGIALHYGGEEADYLTDIYIQYNIFDRMGALTQSFQSKGIELQSGPDNDGVAKRWYIDNNVFTHYTGSSGRVGIYLSDSHSLEDIYVRNNIFQDCNIAYINGNGANGGNVNGLYLQNNILYNNGNSDDPLWEEGYTVVNLTNENNIKDNPDFTDPPNDYTLLAESPAIDAGLGIGLTLDYLGNVVGADPDIGAYEWGASPPNGTDPATVTTSSPAYTWTRAGIGGGNVTNDGGGTVSARGVCWKTSVNPTTSDSYTVDGSGTGEFSSVLTGLSASTTYHVRGYATNESGTSYGANETFTTPKQSDVVNSSGRSYTYNGKTVIIK